MLEGREKVVIFGRHGKEWRWESGSWCFKVLIARNVTVNAKISRVVRQVLEQKERKHTDERWSTWLRESETEVSVLAGGSHSLVNNSGVVSISAGAESQESGSSFQGRVAHGEMLLAVGCRDDRPIVDSACPVDYATCRSPRRR